MCHENYSNVVGLDPLYSHFQNKRQNPNRDISTRHNCVVTGSKILKLHAILAIVILSVLTNSTSLLAQGGNAHVVTYDNGLQWEGEVFDTQQIDESTFARDPFTAENIIVVDDGLRRIFLNKHHVLPLGDSNQGSEVTFEFEQRTVNADTGYGGFVSEGRFDKHGHRTITVRLRLKDKTYDKTFVQAITKATPRYCVLESLVGDRVSAREWSMRISTKKVPKSVLRNMMLNQITDQNNPNQFFAIANFFKQARDFSQAGDELLMIEKRFPGQKDRIRDERSELKQLKARFILQEIANRIDAGQNELGLKMAREFSKVDGLAGEIRAEFQEILDQQSAALAKLDDTRSQIMDLLKNVRNVDPEQKLVAKRLADELETELNLANAPRLDAFLLLGKDKRSTDSMKLARALSGWILGTGLAEDNLADFQALFQIRDFVTEYLQPETTKLRQSEILNALKNLEGATPENIDAMLKQMKPYLAPTKDIAKYDGSKPLEFETQTPGTGAHPEPRTHNVLVHLPTNYDPYRKYPLLISLPDGRQPLEQNLNMWCGAHLPSLNVRTGEAVRNGYVVAAVDYRLPNGQFNWGYSTREHLIVLKALKACLQKFSIDSDRVILSGHGVGADGAYDIGSAHPEHWAGIVGYSGTFDKYTNIYRENRHVHLPFYCVNGGKHINAIRAMKDSLNKWVRTKKYNDITVVHYLGRINEFFQEDIPEAIKWMDAQRRRWPDRNGFEFEVSSLRPTDNYYWFFEMHSLPEERVTRPEFFQLGNLNKLPISGKLSANLFRLTPEGYTEHDSTLWLSPEFVDFDKKIEIKKRKSFRDFVEPSVETILNDVRRRADREHPYWAKIEMKDRNWVVEK